MTSLPMSLCLLGFLAPLVRPGWMIIYRSGYNGWLTPDTDAEVRREIDVCNETRDTLLDLCTSSLKMSCQDRCGQEIHFLRPVEYAVMRICSCDVLCHIYGDCCLDYADVCGEEEDKDELERWKSLQGVKVECQGQFAVIAGCSDNNVTDDLQPDSHDLLEPIVSEAGSGLHFKNRHIYSCHKVAAGLQNMTRWRRKAKASRQRHMTALGRLIVTGEGDDGLGQYFMDKPPLAVKYRQCYSFAVVDCDSFWVNCLDSRPVRMSNVSWACEYVLGNRSLDWMMDREFPEPTTFGPELFMMNTTPSMDTMPNGTTSILDRNLWCSLNLLMPYKYEEYDTLVIITPEKKFSFEIELDGQASQEQVGEFYCVEDFDTFARTIKENEKHNLATDTVNCWNSTAIIMLIESEVESDITSNATTIFVRGLQEEYLDKSIFLQDEYQSHHIPHPMSRGEVHFLRQLNYSLEDDSNPNQQNQYIQDLCQMFWSTAGKAVIKTLKRLGEEEHSRFHGNMTICLSQGCHLECADIIIKGQIAKALNKDITENQGNTSFTGNMSDIGNTSASYTYTQMGDQGRATHQMSYTVYFLCPISLLTAFLSKQF